MTDIRPNDCSQNVLKIEGGTIISEIPTDTYGGDANDFVTFYVSENEMTLVKARMTNIKLNSSVKVRVSEVNLSHGLTAVRSFYDNFVRNVISNSTGALG